MEYAKGGNLFHYVLQHKPLCRLSEAKAQWIFQQLIIGLDYCHRRVSTCLSNCPCCLSAFQVSTRLLPGQSCTLHLLGRDASSTHFFICNRQETRLRQQCFQSKLADQCVLCKQI